MACQSYDANYKARIILQKTRLVLPDWLNHLPIDEKNVSDP